MKTTDNTTTLVLHQLTRDFAASDNSGERANIQERIVAVVRNVEAQRDAAVAALRDLLIQYKKGTCTIDTYYCRQAREAIAATQGSAQ